MKNNKGLTIEEFINSFRKIHKWECKSGTEINKALTKFAKEREGTNRDIHELYVIFCLINDLTPKLD